MKKKTFIVNDEINIRNAIIYLWSEKKIIILISLLSMFFGFLYSSIQPKQYKTSIILREVPEALFRKYSQFDTFHHNITIKKHLITQKYQVKKSFEENFNNEFSANFLSLRSLEQFINKNKEINKSKSYLIKKIKIIKENPINDVINHYSLVYQAPILGEKFLIDYSLFVKKQTEINFKKMIKEVISEEIEIFKQNLILAKSIELDKPNLKVDFNDNNTSELFYRGAKLLSQQIINLNKLLKDTEQLKFNYDPIVQNPTKSNIISPPLYIYLINSFLLSLFLSIIIIYLKFIFSKR